ncbi:MAG: alanine--tRNA ligase, partial [Deltaproteobacteria bacterium]|nr:alanine--tRNA ligase [Deltaproteobacteria bacterium]
DLFVPIIAKIKEIVSSSLSEEAREEQVALRVIADHVRCATFLISDGLFPSNEGRGYVLRRILRRAIRYGRQLGMREPFFAKVAQTVIQEMGEAYPEIGHHQAVVEKVLNHEEERFLETIDRGLAILEEEFQSLGKKKTLPGEIVFKLYDTYGFPKDLTELIAREKKIAIDEKGFEEEMERQKERARKAWKGSGAVKAEPIFQELYQRGFRTEFTGYQKESSQGKILQVLNGNQLLVDQTPFYAEGGGQVGDTGICVGEGIELQVVDTQKPFSDLFVHQIKILEGNPSPGQILKLQIDTERRRKIQANHTATHLLHAALRQILGPHVKQAGSFLDERYLRFDFSHFEAITDEQLADIETLVNKIIAENLKVKTAVLPYKEALEKGALAFFGEKYGDVVRMVQVEQFSTELCGGTHTATTGEIVALKIRKEHSVASGVRRIEAVSMESAQRFATERRQQMEEQKRHEKEKQEVLKNEKAQHSSRIQTAIAGLGDPAKEAETVRGVKVFRAKVSVANAGELRQVADAARQKLQSGVVILAAETQGKAALVVAVTNDHTKEFHAGEIMKKLSLIIGGSGGGKPDLAQGGGPDPSKLAQIFSIPAKDLI